MIKTYTNTEEITARFAKALAHPARISILQFLAKQDSCFFGELNEILPLTKATVSQHLSELKEAGLIQGEIFPPKVKYCINKENWVLAQQLIGALFASISPQIPKCCSDNK